MSGASAFAPTLRSACTASTLPAPAAQWSAVESRVIETKIIDAATRHEIRSSIGGGPEKAAETLFVQNMAGEATKQKTGAPAPEYGSRGWRDACKKKFEQDTRAAMQKGAAREKETGGFAKWREDQVAARRLVIEKAAKFKEDEKRREQREYHVKQQNVAWNAEHERLKKASAVRNKAAQAAAEAKLEKKKLAKTQAEAEVWQRAKQLVEDYHAHKEAAAKALEQKRAQLKKVAVQIADKNLKKDKKVKATESFIVEQTKHADRELRAYVNVDWPTAAEFLENAITQVDQLKKDSSTDGQLGAVEGLVYLHAAFAILRETKTAEGYAFGEGGFIPAVEKAIVTYALHVPTKRGEEWTGFFKNHIGNPGFAAQAFVALASGGSGFLPAAREQLEAMDMLAVEIGPRHARNVALVLAHKRSPPEDENAEGVEEDEDDEEEGGDTQHDEVSADDVWGGQVLLADKEGGGLKASRRHRHHHSHHRSSHGSSHRHSSLRGDHSKRCCCCRGETILQGVGASSSESCKEACVGVRGAGAIYFDKTDPQGSCRSRWTGKCAPKRT